MKIPHTLSALFLVLVIAPVCAAQEPIIYPANGQSQEQMDRDKYECYTWARQQTGFDPMQSPQATAPPPQQPPRSGVAAGTMKGSMKGAMAGGAAGVITGNPRKGAKIGAATGAFVGAARRAERQRQHQQAVQQHQQQQAVQYSRNRDGYYRANAACLEGRGYTIR
ncbi:MAG: hypothetical protein D6B25_17500 [Desulfobulbaceae bacterium]|nr:MAG: hypothetical protein D6B25_17500 [Desulfobulbaceae bacterium]